MHPKACRYCNIAPEDAWVVNAQAVAIPHQQPIARFHMVVVPTRHATGFYDLDVQEQRAIWALVGEIQNRLAGQVRLAGIHIGFEDGSTEQDHTCVHVVPKSAGTTVDLPEGIEWVFLDSNAV